jgi:hypothetical protein
MPDAVINIGEGNEDDEYTMIFISGDMENPDVQTILDSVE